MLKVNVLHTWQAVTERIVWSFSGNDPSDSLGSDAAFHSHQGSLSLNLLGGLSSPTTVPDDLQSFDITVSNVR